MSWWRRADRGFDAVYMSQEAIPSPHNKGPSAPILLALLFEPRTLLLTRRQGSFSRRWRRVDNCIRASPGNYPAISGRGDKLPCSWRSTPGPSPPVGRTQVPYGSQLSGYVRTAGLGFSTISSRGVPLL